MNTKISDLEKQYLHLKETSANISRTAEQKRAELGVLHKQVAELVAKIDALNVKVSKANADIAMGYLTSEGFMAIKREIAEKQTELPNYNEAIAAQASALELIEYQLMIANRELKGMLIKLAGGIKDKIAKDLSVEVGHKIELMVMGIVTANNRNPSYFESEDRNLLYGCIGEELCKNIFNEGTNSFNVLPDVFKAREIIDALIVSKAV
ncbi:MAG: hypothetical protein Q8N35_16040 [Methylococcaceae bacterium]|nr:hypothetical protein [Methylococcaceae bacterium]MDZ4157304.1 hypothetical protein [Methylococcales bacterium]MDP2392593.1 hypothetical protein [Methylococcaceae bacterium]MDP3021093.1 hypothetical protein [Methylococcaceae bacterium]MDP3388480.1 hypothetical protein [Methylococcaceae bacterium]